MTRSDYKNEAIEYFKSIKINASESMIECYINQAIKAEYLK